MKPDRIYLVDPISLSRVAPGLPREALQVAMLFDGHRRLWEVVRDSYLPSRMTLSVFGRLEAQGVVRAPPAGAAAPMSAAVAPATTAAPTTLEAPPAEAPETTAEASTVLAEASAPAVETPASTHGAPASTSQVPASTHGAPASTSQVPASTHGAPASTSQVPASTHGAPASTPMALASTLRLATPPVTTTTSRGPAAETILPTPADTPPLPEAQATHPMAMANTLRLGPPAPIEQEPTARTAAPAAAQRAAATPAPAEKPPTPAFDSADEEFFASYEAEDGGVDSFWDLEDTPSRQLRARKRAQRLQRGGWLRQLLSIW